MFEYRGVKQEIKSPSETQEYKRRSLSLRVSRSNYEGPRKEGPEKRYIEIELSSTEGKKIKLNDLLPEGWRFVETEEVVDRANAYANPAFKEISYPRFVEVPVKGESRSEAVTPDSLVATRRKILKSYEIHDALSLKGGLITLLHEIGHALKAPEHSIDEHWRATMLKTGASMEFAQTGHGIETWSESMILDFIELVLQEERGAWAHALRMYKQLQEEGIDIEDDMSLEDIFTQIRNSLSTYYYTPMPEAIETQRREAQKRSGAQ